MKRPITSCAACTVVALVLTVSTPRVAAVVRNVNSGVYYPTITQAVLAAVGGDRLNVSTGVYVERVEIVGNHLEMYGGYATDCVTKISGGKAYIAPYHGPYIFGATVLFDSICVTGATSMGLNIRGGSVVTSRYCGYLHNRSAVYGNGGGVCVRENSRVVLDRCVLRWNDAFNFGGGVSVEGNSQLTFIGSPGDVSENTAYNGAGVAVINGGTLVLREWAGIRNNVAEKNGGGIYATNDATVVLAGPAVSIGNPTSPNVAWNGYGGGIYAFGSTVIVSNDSSIGCNRTDKKGGGIYSDSSRVFLEDGWVVCNSAGVDGGGIALNGQSELICSNCVLINNAATNAAFAYGGAICGMSSGSRAYLYNCLVNSNIVNADGGAVAWHSSGPLDIVDSVVNGNSARDDGGGIRINNMDTTATFRNVEIRCNEADDSGGAIYAYIGKLDCTDCDIRQNKADADSNAHGYGGGICMFENCHVSLCALNGTARLGANSAARGGGIYIANKLSISVVATGGHSFDIMSNTASEHGGGICAVDESVVAVTGNVVIGTCTAALNGGGVYATNNASVFFAGADGFRPQVYYNTAGGDGGGFYAVGSGVVLRLSDVDVGKAGHPNMSMRTNLCAGGGGAAILYGAHLEASNTRFEHNRCFGKGGGLFLRSASAHITGDTIGAGGFLPLSRFVGNIATAGAWSSGGGVYSRRSNVDVENTFIASNVTDNVGGGIHVEDFSNADLVNLVVSRNRAGLYGAGVRPFNSTAMILQCTVAYNDPGGVECGGDTVLSMTNCIVWGHTGTEVSTNQNVQYCDIEGGYATGTGNIDADPLFAAPSSIDYQLLNGSPCIDTGIYAGVGYDCIGETRPYGDGYDMGAYEWVPEPCLFVIGYWLLVICHLRRSPELFEI